MKMLKVLDPVKSTLPVPDPVIVRLLNVAPPPANVLSVIEVSVIAIVEVSQLKVRFVELSEKTVPVPNTVKVPVPILTART